MIVWKRHWTIAIVCLVLSVQGGREASAQVGPILSGAGAVNRSIGGVAVGNSTSASGSLLWNAASLSGLESSRLEASVELLFPSTTLDSTFNAGSFGPFGPPVDLVGTSNSDNSVFALPAVGLAFRPQDSATTYGLGIFSVAGFGLNYSGSQTNPLLTPPAPNGLGLGPVFSNYQVVQIAPAIVRDVSDRLSFSFSPSINIASLQADPITTSPQNDANGDGFANFSRGSNADTAWGAGFSLGTYYQGDQWSLGASYKSPQWFESFEVDSVDEIGAGGRAKFGIDLPAITSVGASRHLGHDVLLAVDVRYYDFDNARGLGDRGLTPSGAVAGLAFNSVFGVGVGMQFRLTEPLTVRVGYNWNENPIDDADSSTNTLSPLVIEHQISTGLSYQFSDAFDLSAAYLYAVENSVTGPLLLPTGPVAGTSVTNSASAHSVVFGATVRFGN